MFFMNVKKMPPITYMFLSLIVYILISFVYTFLFILYPLQQPKFHHMYSIVQIWTLIKMLKLELDDDVTAELNLGRKC